MRYHVQWPSRAGAYRTEPSRIATWDGVVTQATPALKWAVGKEVAWLIVALSKYRASLHLEPGSERHSIL